MTMFHFYDGYHFVGMHVMWWLFWLAFIAIIFGVFEQVPRRRGSKNVR
jgi:putative membrane protein